LEQAEASLARVEESWKRLLQAQTDATSDDNLTLSDSRTGGSEIVINNPTASDKTSANSNVIAIVNDTALQSGVETDGSQVINIDE